MKPTANKRKRPASGRQQQMQVKMKKKKAPQAQQLSSAHPVYTKRQKSRRHKKVRPYSEPEGADEGWSPAVAGARTDLPPGEVEDRFLPGSLREIMWLKKIADLTPNQRRKYLKSRRRTNPEVGDVAGMRRDAAHGAALRRKRTESQGRFLARVERTAQQALLASQYADRFGSPASASQGKRKQKKQQQQQQQTSGNSPASARGSGSTPISRQQQAAAEAAAASGGRQLSPAEKKQAKQKRRRLASQRPGRLEPVASEPPKVLARIKFHPQRKGSAKFAAAAAAFGGGSGGCGGGSVSAIDRRLSLT